MLKHLSIGALLGFLLGAITGSSAHGPDALALLIFVPINVGAFVILSFASLFTQGVVRQRLAAGMAFAATMLIAIFLLG